MNDLQATWITGAGAVTPLGNGRRQFTDNLLAGRSGVATQQLFAGTTSQAALAAPATTQLAATVAEIPAPPELDSASFLGCNRLEQMCLSCCASALADADLWGDRHRLRIGVVLGLGAEWLRLWELDWSQQGDRVYHPERDSLSTVQLVKKELSLDGPAMAVAAACASGNYALAMGRRWIQQGWLDICLAGGCDLLTPMTYAGFQNLRALSRRAGAPQAASRPFDMDRDGFVIGEGGAVLVLESQRSAWRRGARPLAELAGFGATSDATHMIIPSNDPKPAATAISRALADAGVSPDEVDYVNAHATSTPVGDRAEAKSLQLALGSAAKTTPVSSTKSMTGHLLSAAAAVEALACLAAIERQALPPTINLERPDPECDLLHVPGEARPSRVRVTASNSFGFGGSNTCIVLRQAA